MHEKSNDDLRFLLMFRSERGERMARTVIESLRTFGGPLRNCEVWAFVLEPARLPHALHDIDRILKIPLALQDGDPAYLFAEKVYACARAEDLAGPDVRSLVWLGLDCLIINPPLLFDLGPASGVALADAAFRPVHHQNVGSPAHEPPDGFWRGIYRATGVDEMPHTIESFADGRTLRPYFNTHCFAWDPETNLGHAWWEQFKALASDQAFQAGPCRDEAHQIFLHQAVLSTLVAQRLDWDRLRLLPPEYNYPLNLLGEMPPALRAPSLDGLVNAVYEEAFPWTEIEIPEPLHSWLRERLPD